LNGHGVFGEFYFFFDMLESFLEGFIHVLDELLGDLDHRLQGCRRNNLSRSGQTFLGSLFFDRLLGKVFKVEGLPSTPCFQNGYSSFEAIFLLLIDVMTHLYLGLSILSPHE